MNRKAIKHLNFAVTYHCNSRCIHCNIWKRRPRNELALPEVRDRLLASPLLHGLESVGITGGEPFIRKDLEDLCLAFHEVLPEVHIGLASHGMTGLRIAERALSLRDRLPEGKFSMSISIDGLEQEHDRIRGIQGAFRRTLQTIATLRDAGVNLCLSFTITPDNYRALEGVFHLARETGVGFITRFAQNSAYYGNEELDFPWTEEAFFEVRSMLDRVIRCILATFDLQQDRLDPYIYFLIKAPEYTYLRQRILPCWSGTHSLFIDNYGQVYPCIMLGNSVGSLREKTLEEIYNGPALEASRKEIADKNCNCWTECETIRNLEAMPGLLQWDPRQTLPRFGLPVREIDGALHAMPPEADTKTT